jgi:tetratricopeptide (TPR) repeat protein
LLWQHALYFLVDGLLFAALTGLLMWASLDGTSFLSRWFPLDWFFAAFVAYFAVRRFRDYWHLRRVEGEGKGAAAAVVWGLVGAAAIALDSGLGNPYSQHIDRGRTYAENKEYDKAIDEFTQAIQIEPRETAAYWNRALVRQKMDDQRGAMTDFSMVIELEPTRARAFLNRGECRHKLKDLDGAIADYTRTLELAPNDLDGYRLRGIALYQQGKLDDARRDWEKVWKEKPELKVEFEKLLNDKK